MRIKLDKADQYFSLYIRERDDWTCQKCHKKYERYSKGLQCSHFHSRRHEGTRFDPNNGDSLCYGCHAYCESDKQSWYSDFKLKQLGKQGFDMLKLARETYCKKDRKLMLIICKQAYQDLCKQKGIEPKKV